MIMMMMAFYYYHVFTMCCCFSKLFICIIFFNPYKTLGGRSYCYPHLTDKETETSKS